MCVYIYYSEIIEWASQIVGVIEITCIQKRASLTLFLASTLRPQINFWGFPLYFHWKGFECPVIQKETDWWFEALWKIWVRQLGWLFPIDGKIKNVPNHQPGQNGGISWNGGTPKSSILNRLFHYKPTSWGYPTFEETSKSQNEKFQGLEVRNHESVYHDSAACSVTLCRPLSGVDHCHSISLVPWFSQKKYIANIAIIVGSSCPKKWLHSCAMCKSSLKAATLETQSGLPSAGNSLLDFQSCGNIDWLTPKSPREYGSKFGYQWTCSFFFLVSNPSKMGADCFDPSPHWLKSATLQRKTVFS